MASRAQRVRRPGAPIGRWLSPGIMINPNEPLQKQHRRPKAVIGPRNRVGSISWASACSAASALPGRQCCEEMERSGRPVALSSRLCRQPQRPTAQVTGAIGIAVCHVAARANRWRLRQSARPRDIQKCQLGHYRQADLSADGSRWHGLFAKQLRSLKFISFALHGTRNEPKAPSHQSPRAIS